MHGELERLEDGGWQLRFTRRLAHPRETVWRAVTEPEHLERWFPTTVEGERRAGAALRFEHRDGEAPPFEGELLAYDPPSVLEFTWGTDVIRIELADAGDGTRLTLTDRLDERGKGARDAAGWHVCLDALGRHVDGDADGADPVSAWRAVHPVYVERFGPEAATIGPPEAYGGD